MNVYKKIFLDTCVLSDIGRMNKEKRAKLAYEFLVNKKYKIIVPTYILDELEKIPDKSVKENVYDFLELSYVGFPKGADKIFAEEIEANKNNTYVEIVEFNVSMLQKDANGITMDFKNFKHNLLNNHTFKIVTNQNEQIKKYLQNKKRPLTNIEDYFNLIVLNHLYNYKILKPDYNIFPGFTVWAYSLAHKIESKGLKKKYNELNDVAMSYIVPYVDIVVAEKRQINLYNQMKDKKILNCLDKIIFKKYNEVFEAGEFKIENI
ncbi:MAG: hypothetical protein IKT41_02140 [Clostridia bacterium]|nr:hypothetical protein [Clostridia bacterium]